MASSEDISALIDEKTKDSKRAPGRPKKEKPIMSLKLQGVIDKPEVPGHIVELIYCKPILFRKLLALFKSFDTDDLLINFLPDCIKFSGKDHLEKTLITATINGKCMNLYYCERDIKIVVDRASFGDILGAVNNDQCKITFILGQDYRSSMYVIIKDLEYDIDNTYQIDINYQENPTTWLHTLDDSNYPIKFKLNSKQFKNQINNIRKFSSHFSIQKCGDEPIQFTYEFGNKVKLTSVCNNSEKIELESKILPDDIFNITVDIDYIKPLTNAILSKYIHIAADKKLTLSLTCYLDSCDIGNKVVNTCEVKIFSELKEYMVTT